MTLTTGQGPSRAGPFEGKSPFAQISKLQMCEVTCLHFSQWKKLNKSVTVGANSLLDLQHLSLSCQGRPNGHGTKWVLTGKLVDTETLRRVTTVKHC